MSMIKRNNVPGMTNLFDDFFSKDLWNWRLDNHSTTNTTLPAVNISESVEKFIVEMAAPGMNKEDFKIELDGNTLTITSEKSHEGVKNGEARYTRREFMPKAYM